MPNSMKNSPELTTEDVQRFLIQPLTAASVVLANGPNIYDSHGDPLRIPKYIDAEDPEWFAENEQIDEVEPDFDEVTLLPTNLKSIKVLHRFSNELARHAIVDIGATMNAALVRQVASKMDQQFLTGTGTPDTNGNRTPIGLVNQADIQTGDWDGTDADTLLDSAVDAVGKFIVTEQVDLSRCVWFMNSTDYLAHLKVKTPDGRSYLVPDITAPGNYTLQGIKVVPTSKLPAGTQLLVNMAFVAVGRDLAPQVKFFDQTYADYDQMAIRVVCRMDIGLLHPEGVLKLS